MKIVILDGYGANPGDLSWDGLSEVGQVTVYDRTEPADVLSLHCPLADNTRRMIDADALRQMKPSAVLINTGRGPLVDEDDVAEALASGRLAAYCADVMVDEPPRADSPLLRQPNAFFTPHVAWATREARVRLLSIAIDNVRAFAAGHPQNTV